MGKGKAWHVASRNDLAFQRDFFTAISKELSLPRAVAADFPPGVVATARTDGETTYVFLQNYSAQQQQVTLPQGYQDSLTGHGTERAVDLKSVGLPHSQSSRVIFLYPRLLTRAGVFLSAYQESIMVSLKSFLNYFSQSRPAVTLSPAEQQQIERLIQAFGGEANIVNVDACITRLRVTVNNLSIVDSQRLQQQGALGVIILGQQVHAIFGKQSDALRQLLDEHFASRK